MGNFLNKFLKNKNTVTILGVLACLVILFVGYNMRINQKTSLVTVFYANQTIQPKTLITEEMVSRTQVPASFILGSYYRNYDDIVGKYSNYNTMIAEGSLFYYDTLVEESSLPDAVLYNVNEGERVVSFPVNMVTTYGNSMMPGNKVDVYVKMVERAQNNNNNAVGKVIYGEFFENVEILAVKDSQGRNVFENTEEARTPAYIYFTLPEAKYLLFTSLNYLKNYIVDSQIDVALVPNTIKYDAGTLTATEVTSSYLYDYVLNNIKEIDDQKELYEELLNEMEQQELERKNRNTATPTPSPTAEETVDE